MAIRTEKSSLPHLEWLDLGNDNVMIECAVMKRDEFGNIYYIPLTALDAIDRGRMRDIVCKRNAHMLPLWEVMQAQTLGNGVNALDYFHQLVKIVTPDGVVMDPQVGRIGVSKQTVGKRTVAPKGE